MIPSHASLPLAQLVALLAPQWQCPKCGVRLWDRERQRCGCAVPR